MRRVLGSKYCEKIFCELLYTIRLKTKRFRIRISKLYNFWVCRFDAFKMMKSLKGHEFSFEFKEHIFGFIKRTYICDFTDLGNFYESSN